MTRIVLKLEISETGKTVQTQNITLENTNPLVLAADFYLSPHLSIGLPEGLPFYLTFHSEQDTMLNPEKDAIYSYTYYSGHHMPIPRSGTAFYSLEKGNTFSITKTQKDYYKVIKAEVILVDQTPHEEPTFPEEFHISP